MESERVAAVAKQQIPASEYIFGCFRNTQKLCDRLVVGIEVGARGAAKFDDERRAAWLYEK